MDNIIEQMVDYSRQSEMDSDLNHVQNGAQVIVGCGGIGYWLALMLVMMGTNDIVLIDGDKVESSNLNRLPVPIRMNGEWKVKALKAQIRMLRPTVRVTCLPVHVSEDTLNMVQARQAYARVWDCTDDARIQKLLSKFCTRQSMSYTKIGYEGWDIGMYTKMEDTWLQDEYTPGYTSSRANVISSMMAAGMGIMYAGLNVRQDRQVDLKQVITGEEAPIV